MVPIVPGALAMKLADDLATTDHTEHKADHRDMDHKADHIDASCASCLRSGIIGDLNVGYPRNECVDPITFEMSVALKVSFRNRFVRFKPSFRGRGIWYNFTSIIGLYHDSYIT